MLENKNIGQSHFEDLCVINKQYLPMIQNYILLEIYETTKESVVPKFDVKDWKKNVKKLLNKTSQEFDVMGIIETNFIQFLDQEGYFVDVIETKKTVKIEVFQRTKLIYKFLLADWKKEISLLGIGSDEIKNYDHNKFIAELFEKMYSKRNVLVVDKETLAEQKKTDNTTWLEKVMNLNKKFIENFSKEYCIDIETTTELLDIAKKFIFDNGYPHYEEMMIDIYNFNNK